MLLSYHRTPSEGYGFRNARQYMNRPSNELISAATAVVTVKAFVEVLRPKIRAIQTDLIDYLDIRCDEQSGLLDPDHVYLAPEADQAEYFAMLDKWYREAGYTDMPEGHCPLLIAESLLRQAERLFMEASIELSARAGFTPEMIEKVITCQMVDGLKQRQKYLDLNLGLVVPFIAPIQLSNI